MADEAAQAGEEPEVDVMQELGTRPGDQTGWYGQPMMDPRTYVTAEAALQAAGTHGKYGPYSFEGAALRYTRGNKMYRDLTSVRALRRNDT